MSNEYFGVTPLTVLTSKWLSILSISHHKYIINNSLEIQRRPTTQQKKNFVWGVNNRITKYFFNYVCAIARLNKEELLNYNKSFWAEVLFLAFIARNLILYSSMYHKKMIQDNRSNICIRLSIVAIFGVLNVIYVVPCNNLISSSKKAWLNEYEKLLKGYK